MYQRFCRGRIGPMPSPSHEAFAIVALFQHFTFPGVAPPNRATDARRTTWHESLLEELAEEFGRRSATAGALRSHRPGSIPTPACEAEVTPTTTRTRWSRARGAILVVFDAFSIYRRVADLLRIATNGTGVICAPRAPFIPIVDRLAAEASSGAARVDHVRSRSVVSTFDIDFTVITCAPSSPPTSTSSLTMISTCIASDTFAAAASIRARNVRTRAVDQIAHLQNPVGESGLLHRWRPGCATTPTTSATSGRSTETGMARPRSTDSLQGYRQLRFSRVAGITFKHNLTAGSPPISMQPVVRRACRRQIHSLRPSRHRTRRRCLNQLIISIIQTRELPLDQDRNRTP